MCSMEPSIELEKMIREVSDWEAELGTMYEFFQDLDFRPQDGLIRIQVDKNLGLVFEIEFEVTRGPGRDNIFEKFSNNVLTYIFMHDIIKLK